MADNYRTAPTFLYKEDGSSKLFKTQEAVDQAWKDGWYGPPWLKEEEKSEPLLSAQEFASKADFLMHLEADSRYEGLKLTDKMNWEEIKEKLAEFEAGMNPLEPDYPDEGDQ